MERLNFQGHHPKIRQYFPHFKEKVIRKKTRTITYVLTTAKQLEVLWTKFGAYTTEKGERILNTLIDLVVLDANETGKESLCGGEIACGGLGDYSITYANPSRPPPKKHGWIYNMMRYAAMFLVGILLLGANACHKDPTPEPNPTPGQNDTTIVNPPFNPEDTITPWRKIVIDWNWDAVIGWAPPKDTIKYYTDQKNVGNVKINLIGIKGSGFPVNCTSYPPSAFGKARDTLQTRIDIDSLKVGLSGTIWARNANATNHNPDQPNGITPYDMEWFRRHGCNFKFSEKRNAFFIRRHR